MTETTATKARVRRTPAEIAQAELDKADARVSAATKRHEKAQTELDSAVSELERAKAFRNYAAGNPDLPSTEAQVEPEPEPMTGVSDGDLPGAIGV